MKIAVMGGTPIDTKFGEELLRKNGFDELILLPISKNPIEQTSFQALEKIEKEQKISEYIKTLKKENCNILFVYCNSLSSSVDFDLLAKKYDIKIVTPIAMYENIAKNYNYIAVMAANAHGLVGIENKLYKSNEQLKIFGLSSLELVKDIENNADIDIIVKKYNFSSLTNYIESLGIEAIVLGCTHFPYIKESLQKHTSLTIIDVGDYMISNIKNN